MSWRVGIIAITFIVPLVGLAYGVMEDAWISALALAVVWFGGLMLAGVCLMWADWQVRKRYPDAPPFWRDR